MGLDQTTPLASSHSNLAREDFEALIRLRQNYPSHVLASFIDENSAIRMFRDRVFFWMISNV
jgi:hypothetical protein